MIYSNSSNRTVMEAMAHGKFHDLFKMVTLRTSCSMTTRSSPTSLFCSRVISGPRTVLQHLDMLGNHPSKMELFSWEHHGTNWGTRTGATFWSTGECEIKLTLCSYFCAAIVFFSSSIVTGMRW